jgi:hypothetical protein
MKALETIRCRGHRNIRGTHPSTFEVTTEDTLTPQGDCIIGVGADRGIADLDKEFLRLLRDDRARLYTTLRAGTCEIQVISRGTARFTLTHPHDLVWRRSTYVDDRTVGILSDQAAVHLPRDFIGMLREEKDIIVEMVVVTPE